MKRFGFLGGALILSALGMVACDGDDNTAAPETDAGIDSAASGDDASLPAEAGNDATVPVDAGADSALGDAGADSARGEAGADSGALDGGDASTPSFALFVGTDFSNAELAVVALHPDTVAGRLLPADQDSIPRGSGGHGFLLERELGKVIVLDPAQPWVAKSTIDINDSPDASMYASNPQAIVVTTGTKAYVARYASNVVKIVDVASGAVTGTLDLSAYVAPDDPDGLVDIWDAAYDATSGRAYFLLQRIDQFDFGPEPDTVNDCLASHAEIVGIDVSNDSIVDLNGAAEGNAIDLLGDNPASLTPDFAHGRFIVPETGCYQPLAADAGDAGDPATAPRLGRGIEQVTLSTGAPAWLYRQTGAPDRLSGFVWVDETHAYVSEGPDWFAWNPTQTTLGSAVPNFPRAPVYDGAGRVVGLAFSAPDPDAGADAGSPWSVVAFSVATSQLSTIASNPFKSVNPDRTYGVSSALLR